MQELWLLSDNIFSGVLNVSILQFFFLFLCFFILCFLVGCRWVELVVQEVWTVEWQHILWNSNCEYFTIADSAQTEYCTTFHCSSVRASVTGVTPHISRIYKGINAMLIIRGPIKPCIFWIKIILTFFLTRPDQTRPSSQTWPTWPLTLTWNYQK